ncbi:MAG: hypothetical protein WC663_05050 [Patescibacteria group bacterium]|jgi:hypothetical protein
MGLVWIPIVKKDVDGRSESFFETPNFMNLAQFVKIFLIDVGARELKKFTEGFETPHWKLDEEIKPGAILKLTTSPYSHVDHVVVVAVRDDRADFLIGNTLERARAESEQLKKWKLDRVRKV